MSINNITFVDQFFPKGILFISDPIVNRFYFNDILEITQFLGSLKGDKVYVLSLELVYSWLIYDDEDCTVITLSKPILITKNSNPRVISNFIKSRLFLAIDSYFLDDSFIYNKDYDGPGVLVKYKEINLF